MLDKINRVTVSLVLALFWSAGAQAQGLESLGTRAAALAAFVAVADDASAVAWNPSGLVGGPIFNVTFGLGRLADETAATGPGARRGRLGTTLVAIGTTPVGVAFYRISSRSAEALNPAVSSTFDRESKQTLVRTLVTNHVGVSVQQSVGDFVTFGATLKLVRGSVNRTIVLGGSWDEAFEAEQALEGRGSTRGDLDIGAMFATGRLRTGVVIRNVTTPTFGENEAGDDRGAISLERHARVGMAWGDGWPGISRLIVSFDADVTRVPHPAGERRDVAAGIERWMRDQQVGLRAGLRASTVGDRRLVISAGGSYALRPGVFVDAYVARGTRDDRGWGLAARLSY